MTKLVSYTLLAEFDIEEGSVLKYQHPCPTGTDDHLLATLMLPDGAHLFSEDWTVFYLNQTPKLTVVPQSDDESGRLLYVLSLMRTQKDDSKRGASVKAMAVCTVLPCIEIFKPVLLLALESYFTAPSRSVIVQLYDSINALDISNMPTLSDDEKWILRASDRKDLLEEKFSDATSSSSLNNNIGGSGSTIMHSLSSSSIPSAASSIATTDWDATPVQSTNSSSSQNANFASSTNTITSSHVNNIHSTPPSTSSSVSSSTSTTAMLHHLRHQRSQSKSTPDLQEDSDAVEDLTENRIGTGAVGIGTALTSTSTNVSPSSSASASIHQPTSSAASIQRSTRGDHTSISSLSSRSTTRSRTRSNTSIVSLSQDTTVTPFSSSSAHNHNNLNNTSNQNVINNSNNHNHQYHHNHGHHPRSTLNREQSSSYISSASFSRRLRDMHHYETKLTFDRVTLPLRISLTTFPEQVGEYSLISLIQHFSGPTALVPSTTLHPHLHTNGTATHPIILLFNALVTQKRILFLGSGKPAGQVASFVLAACGLGSGCGSILQGFAERAFPYSNLENAENMESVQGYIGGVTNPLFEEQQFRWDVLCNIVTGKITVSRDLRPPTSPKGPSSASEYDSMNDTDIGRAPQGSLSSGNGIAGSAMVTGAGGTGAGGTSTGGATNRMEARADCSDNIFMEDIMAAIAAHVGETVIRAKFTDYLMRFIRLASRFEEEVFASTSIGYPSSPYSAGRLGSGVVFADETSRVKEMSTNVGRIEGWRVTKSYQLWRQSFQIQRDSVRIRGFDLSHQLGRLRQARKMSPGEAELIFQTLAHSLQGDEQILELLARLPSHSGGLGPIAFGLFHPSPLVRDYAVDILNIIMSNPTGNKFIHSLNAFHRYGHRRLRNERQAAASLETGSVLSNGGIHQIGGANANSGHDQNNSNQLNRNSVASGRSSVPHPRRIENGFI